MINFPKIMGILNITPDSFSDGGYFINLDDAKKQVDLLISQEVDIIDIGGESSRPGSDAITASEELKRILPVLKYIKENYPNQYLSVDTYKSEVAEQVLDLGVNMINDISGLNSDSNMLNVTSKYNAEIVIMHKKGNPKTMQSNPKYYNLIQEIREFLIKQTNLAKNAELKKVYIDPGIGFGKTFDDNINILKNIDEFSNIADGLLIGFSRKAFLGHFFNIENYFERDIPSLILHTLLINKKIDIIRVHNVSLFNQLKLAKKIFS